MNQQRKGNNHGPGLEDEHPRQEAPEEEEEDAKVLRLTLYIFYLEQITI
jgi:hypothetical protein